MVERVSKFENLPPQLPPQVVEKVTFPKLLSQYTVNPENLEVIPLSTESIIDLSTERRILRQGPSGVEILFAETEEKPKESPKFKQFSREEYLKEQRFLMYAVGDNGK